MRASDVTAIRKIFRSKMKLPSVETAFEMFLSGWLECEQRTRGDLAGGGVVGANESNLYPGLKLRDAEWNLIRITLAHHGGNISRSAKSLGILRTTLSERIKKYRAQERAADAIEENAADTAGDRIHQT